MDMCLYVFPLLGLVAVLAGCCAMRRAGKAPEISPVVRELLELAVHEGSLMEVKFAGSEGGSRSFLGPCADVDAEAVLVDVALHREHPAWKGQDVEVSFKSAGRKAMAFYRFTSCIRGMPRRGEGFGLLLDRPAEIVSAQRRRYVRIALPNEAVRGLDVWLLAKDEHCLKPDTLGQAWLRFRRSKDDRLAVLNISAAGLRLEVRRESGDDPFDLDPGTRLMCLLELRETKGGSGLFFWLDCNVMNRLEQGYPATVAFGLSFCAWALPDAAGGPVNWSQASEGGWVAPLGAWVWQQQLLQVARRTAH